MRRFFFLSLALLLIPAAARFFEKHVEMAGRVYDRAATVLVLRDGVPEDGDALARFSGLYWLDLRGRGLSPEEYEKIAQAAGDARILWELDFQGKPVGADARVLEIDHLTDRDVETLDYLPRLRQVNAENCRDYPQLLALMERRPNCDIRCAVELV